MLKILTDDVISGRTLVEILTGNYYTVDTFSECKEALAKHHFYLNEGYKLKDIPELSKKGGSYVVVDFSDEENFTEHEYRVIPVPKKYVRDVKIRLSSTEFYSN